MIKVVDLGKSYFNGKTVFHALADINLEIFDGEFLAIMGQSGSGKSTLLNLIAGLDNPTKGSIVIDDQEISGMTEGGRIMVRREKMGFVFQSFHLLLDLTVLENIMMPLLIKGISYKKSKESAIRLLSLVGLSQKCRSKPEELSGGQKQRVAIARSLASSPTILLADEPTGNLDSANGKEILELLKKVNKTTGLTIILVTHSQKASEFADRKVFLEDGRLVESSDGGI